MNNKILFVDINGTVTRSKDGSPFTSEENPTAIELVPGVAAALDRHVKDVIIGISNQGGIGAGKRTFDSVIAEMEYTLQLHSLIDEVYFCPDFAGQELWCVDRSGANRCDQLYPNLKGTFRKPDGGMILAAIKRHHDLSDTFIFVGDRLEDEQAAIAAKIPFQWAHEWRGDKSPF